MSLGCRDSNMHFKRYLDMMLRPNRIFTFDQKHERPEAEGKFTTDVELIEQTHIPLFKHLHGAAQIETSRLHSDFNNA
jgi:hypothetical protein